MRPRRSRDRAWHHPLERVWCISIRSWLLLCSSQLRIRRLRSLWDASFDVPYHDGDDVEDQGDDPHNLSGPVRTLQAEVVVKAAEDVPGNSMEKTPFIKKRLTTAHRAPSTPIIDEQRGRDLDRSLKAAQGQKLQPHYRALPVVRQRRVREDLHPGCRSRGRPRAR